jgi:cation diffusion facilitator CzcD-associated flavoprotein CzcO
MKSYQWAVVGAGPAGIAAVGELLDHNISPADIVWIDPEFRVGDFGTKWRNVPSNTKASLFLKFLQAIKAFKFDECNIPFALLNADKNKTCALALMADPLQWVTDHLSKTVVAIHGHVEKLSLQHTAWQVTLSNSPAITAHNVILAIGSEPKTLPDATHHPVIPLHDALDAERLKAHLQPDETVAVFGSSHSAMLALRNLVEAGAEKIINFYRSPLRYAVYYDDWILFDDTGLKGTTADWARQFIDGELPPALTRVYASPENVREQLTQCDKVIAAVGFERRRTLTVEGMDRLSYVKECGIIEPGLFGLGIAFPEAKTNRLGLLEHRVGLWKFMEYLKRVLPIWLAYQPK